MAKKSNLDARPALKRDLLRTLERLRSSRIRIHIPAADDSGRRRQGSQFHSTPEFFIQTGGGTEFDCPGGHFTVRTREVCVMPSEVPHAETPINLRSPYGIIVCMQAKDGLFLQRAKADAQGEILSYATTHLKSTYAQNAFRYLDEVGFHEVLPAKLRSLYARALVEAFLIVVLAELQRSLDAGTAATSPLLSEAERLVRQQLSDPTLTVARIAKSLKISPDHLTRTFRWKRGLSPRRWIIRERVTLALNLLSQGQQNVSEIGWACGFREPSYFIRVFRRLVGVTPRTFLVKLNKNRSTGKDA